MSKPATTVAAPTTSAGAATTANPAAAPGPRVPNESIARPLLRLALGFGRTTWPFDLAMGLMVVGIHWYDGRVAAALGWWCGLIAVLLGRWAFCLQGIARNDQAVRRSLLLPYALFAAAEGVLWGLVLVALPLESPYASLLTLSVSMAIVFGALLPYGTAGRPWIAFVVPLGLAQLVVMLTRDLPLREPLVLSWALALAAAGFTASRLRRALMANVAMRRRAEQARRAQDQVAAELTRSREQLRLALDAIDAGIAETNLITGERFYSSRYAELLGYASRDEVTRHHRFSNAIHPDDRIRVLDARRRHLDDGAPFREELRLQRRDGSYLWVQVRGESVRGIDGRPTRFVASLVDIGAKRAAELRIADSERRYRALVETSPSLIWTCDSSARITFVSDRACRKLYGLEPGEVLGRHVAEFSAPGFGRRQFLRRFAPLLRGRPVFDVEAIQQTRGRAQVVVQVSAVPIAGPDGALQSVFGVCSDITGLKRREGELSVALRNQQALFDAAGEGIVFLRDGVVERVNRALVRMLGVTREALLGRPLIEALVMRIDWSAFERATFDAALRGDGVHQDVMVQTQSGRAAWCQLAARAVGDGAMILVVTDVTALKQREELAWHQANHDELTGLPNRRSLIDHARRLLSVATRQNRRAALLVIDLDGFKQFNDQFGHAYGDALLRRVALRMASVVREYDVVARTGGDEFVVMLPYIESAEVAALVAEKLVGAIAADNLDAARSRAVTASIGIALAPEDGHDFDTLMGRADAAMYAAKASGKNQWAMALALRPRLEAPLAAA